MESTFSEAYDYQAVRASAPGSVLQDETPWIAGVNSLIPLVMLDLGNDFHHRQLQQEKAARWR